MSVDDDNNFSKQRRNLIIISSILLLHDILGIQYKDFKIFEMEITKPENLSWLIWIFWGYFLLRYFSLFFEKGSTLVKPIKEIFFNYKKKSIIKHFQNNRNVVTNIEPVIKNNITSGYKVTIKNKGDFICDNSTFNNELNFPFILKFQFFSFIKYILKTHYFFEYYFPILFALSPVILFFYNHFVPS